MSWWLVLLVNLAGVLGVSKGDYTNITAPEDTFHNVMQMVTNHCYGLYSPGCVQFEVINQMEKLFSSAAYEILPGVFLSRQNAPEPTLPPELTDSLGRDLELETTTQTLNNLLAERMFTQLRTWSVGVYVFGNSTLEQLRHVMDLYLSDQQEVETGRKHKVWKYMGSALLTVAFSILSALISKSLTLSIIALALTLLSGRNNFGFGVGASNSPAVAYRSPPPMRTQVSHTNEVQYVDEMPDDGAQPYVYVNRKAWKTARSDDHQQQYYNK